MVQEYAGAGGSADPQAQLPPTRTEPNGERSEHFASLSELRRTHLQLVRERSKATLQTDAPEGAEPTDEASPAPDRQIEQFLKRAQATGLVIDGIAERDLAQGILDYWTAADDSAGRMALRPYDPSTAPILSDEDSPFIGLNAFNEVDVKRFFGRDESVATLVDMVNGRRLVTVVGPSGSGKSSLILAGLLPRLKGGAVPGSENWRYLTPIVPGTDPLASLMQAVCPPGEAVEKFIARERPRLQRSPEHITTLIANCFADRAREPAFLTVDQLEELFTLCEDHGAQVGFALALAALANIRSPSHRVVITIREDYLKRARQLPGLADLLQDSKACFNIPPFTPRQLQMVIEKPAKDVGLKFADGIVDDLVREVSSEPTALPLLQLTLTKLWEGRERNRITWDVYDKVGKPREAMQRAADAVYNGFIPEDRTAAQRIFEALVQPAAGSEFVRSRVRRQTLKTIMAADRIERVLDRLVGAGLVRMTSGMEADDDRFEVAHEALIRNWPLFHGWLQEKRHRSNELLQLKNDARLWAESGRKAEYLLSGSRLTDAESYDGASVEVRDFVSASKKRAASRKHLLYAVTSVLALVIILVVTWITYEQNRNNAELQLLADELKQSADATTKILRIQQFSETAAYKGQSHNLAVALGVAMQGEIPALPTTQRQYDTALSTLDRNARIVLQRLTAIDGGPGLLGDIAEETSVLCELSSSENGIPPVPGKSAGFKLFPASGGNPAGHYFFVMSGGLEVRTSPVLTLSADSAICLTSDNSMLLVVPPNGYPIVWSLNRIPLVGREASEYVEVNGSLQPTTGDNLQQIMAALSTMMDKAHPRSLQERIVAFKGQHVAGFKIELEHERYVYFVRGIGVNEPMSSTQPCPFSSCEPRNAPDKFTKLLEVDGRQHRLTATPGQCRRFVVDDGPDVDAVCFQVLSLYPADYTGEAALIPMRFEMQRHVTAPIVDGMVSDGKLLLLDSSGNVWHYVLAWREFHSSLHDLKEITNRANELTSEAAKEE